MTRSDLTFTAVLLAVHLCLIVLLPGANGLSDVEITSLTGGLLGTDELAASMKTGAVMPHPTPFWLCAGAWVRVTRSPWLLRLPSIITSLLVIVLIVRFGIRHLSRAAGMTAAIFYACSPAAAAVARTFGPDCGFMLAAVTAAYSFLSGWKRQEPRSWAVFLGALIFMMYWHTYGVFLYVLIWLAMGSVLLWQGRLHRARDPVRPPVGEALVATALAAVAYAPWFFLLGRHVRFPASPGPVSASGFYDIVLQGYGSGSIIGFVPLCAAAVAGCVLGLRTERVSLSSGRVLLSTKSFLPTFFLVVIFLLYVPCLFAFHRTTATVVSHGGVTALLPVFLFLTGIGVSRIIPHSINAPSPREFAVTMICGAVLAGIGWRAPSGSARTQASVWEDAAAYVDGKVREADIVVVSPDEAKVFMIWASSTRPWASLVRGESWLSRYDAGPNLDRVATIWLCEGSTGAGTVPRVRVTRLIKVGGLDIGTTEAAGHYVSGMDSRLEESANPRQPFTFSWALGSHAKIDYPLETNRPASAVVLRAESFSLPQKVTIDLNKRRKTQVEMRGGWQHYLMMFDPPEFLPGQYGRIDLHFSTHRPPTSPDGTPWRMKAVALDYIAVFSRQQVVYFPPETERQEKERNIRRTRRVAPMGLQRGGQTGKKGGLNRPPAQRNPQAP